MEVAESEVLYISKAKPTDESILATYQEQTGSLGKATSKSLGRHSKDLKYVLFQDKTGS